MKNGISFSVLFATAPSVAPEYRISPHEFPMFEGRSSEEHLAFSLDAADDSGLSPYGGVGCHGEPVCNAHLPGENAVLAHLRGPGYANHCAHYCILAHLDIMSNLAEIVDFHAVVDDGGADLGLVYAGIGSYFHIVAYYDIAGVLDFAVSPVLKRSKAETVRTYYSIGVNDDVVADFHSRIYFHSRINDASAAYLDSLADIDLFVDFREIPHFCLFAYETAVAHIDFLANLG